MPHDILQERHHSHLHSLTNSLTWKEANAYLLQYRDMNTPAAIITMNSDVINNTMYQLITMTINLTFTNLMSMEMLSPEHALSSDRYKKSLPTIHPITILERQTVKWPIDHSVIVYTHSNKE